MKRNEQREVNQKAIDRTVELLHATPYPRWRRTYKNVVAVLNTEGLRNSRGSAWGMKTFYLMLSRSGYSGLHGLNAAYRAGAFENQLSSIKRGQ